MQRDVCICGLREALSIFLIGFHMDNTQTTNETHVTSGTHVTRQVVPEVSRMDTVDKLFGILRAID